MGTNYFLRKKPCETCGEDKELHIGKSSAGWCFGLHIYPDEGISNLKDWTEQWENGFIFDEYGKQVSSLRMLDIITKRKSDPMTFLEWQKFNRENYSVTGPNNLARSVIDNHHCIGHGKGTWDLIDGDFC
jgi:hypothetical protein